MRTLAYCPVVALVGLFALGCGSDRERFGEDAPDGGTKSSDGTLPFSDAGAIAHRCSDDLRGVVDEGGKPTATCPPDQVCSAGACVPACDGARANRSSIGCDYWAVNPDGWSNIPGYNTRGTSMGGCFAAFVVNAWATPAKLGVEYDGQTLDASKIAYLTKGSGSTLSYVPLPNGEIPPNEVAIVFLAQFGGSAFYKSLCPAKVSAGVTNRDVGVHGTGLGKAFHVTTSVPSVAYDIYPYGGANSYISSATLLLPSSAWDTNYVMVGGGEAIDNFITKEKWPLNFTVLAAEDGTDVTISPTQPILAAGGVAGTGAGVPISYSLDRGQYLQISQNPDLTGSPLVANKPVAVFGGHYCMLIPQTASACDVAHQQIPPVKALGNEYVAIRHRNRGPVDETVVWRIVGAVAGTQLTYAPAKPKNAPTTLAAGQSATFESEAAFVVKSQDVDHPFYVATHMSGGDWEPAQAAGLGDPEFVNVLPPDQYLTSYVFFTDPSYGNTNVVLVRRRGKDGKFATVTLDCAGAVAGWQPVGDYEYTRVDLAKYGQAVGTCTNGRHSIASSAPFGITVWGFDQYVSYAYPAGASVRPINQVVVPALPR